MEEREKQLIVKLAPDHPELQQWVSEHQAFEAQLDDMNHRPYLSAEEDLERKRLQKAKLVVKDKIQRFLDEHQG